MIETIMKVGKIYGSGNIGNFQVLIGFKIGALEKLIPTFERYLKITI